MGWRNPCDEVTKQKPLFLTIYGAVIIGVILSSLYVFTALNSENSPYASIYLSSSSNSGEGSILQAPRSSPSMTPDTYSVPLNKSPDLVLKPIWESPKTKKMPPLKTFRLTKKLVEECVKDNIVIVTFGNYAFMDFVLNWVRHLTNMGLSNLLVGAMDTKLLEALYWKGVPVFDMGSHMSTVDVGWGTPAFHKMGREKAILIDSILPFGYEVLMCDTDMVWLKNPLPYFGRFPEADILTSTDQVVPTVVDDRLDVWQQVTGALNVGIFHWRPTISSKKLAKEWKEMLLADDKIWDQNGFNDLIRRQLGPSVDGENGLLYAYDGNLKLGFLPASIFCNGHTYFVQAMHEQFKLEPYAVHTTFQYAGTEGKRHRLREGRMFHDSPEYYNSPGGFMSFKSSVPKSLLMDGEHNVESHFAVVNYQIKQIRGALAIASLLNRTLVMPPIWCRLDRLWYGHPGILEGTVTRQPFICPLDHVFEVNVMKKNLPEREFGPHIDIREYSFLDNPALPQEVKESWLDVQLCQVGSKDCNITNGSSIARMIKLPRHSSEETLKTLFSSYKNVKVINFLSIGDAFLGFEDKEKEEKFRKRVKRYVGIWCCVMDHIPGHIYYDMYWDEKPEWKPLPPQKPEDDHPPV
ncbi:arabinosyltransferase XEG113-like [Silene latifolia]|uniref:arabinosyltransferase XEG113-like n=1 Tax=Silene latifolia TaxID=37657 RepID=UPI003D78A46B